MPCHTVQALRVPLRPGRDTNVPQCFPSHFFLYAFTSAEFSAYPISRPAEVGPHLTKLSQRP